MQLLVQRVEDITAHVQDRQERRRRQLAEETWRARALVAESEVFTRPRDVQAAREAERAGTRQLAALAEAGVRVAAADDVGELTDVLIHRALGALGAQGGAVAVREDEVVRLSITASLGEHVQLRYAQLPLDDPLPAAVTSTTGRRIFLHDRAETLAHGHDAEGIVTTSGCQAWAFLPLLRPEPAEGAGGVLRQLDGALRDLQVEALASIVLVSVHRDAGTPGPAWTVVGSPAPRTRRRSRPPRLTG